jgi:tight adherence protein B
MTVAALLLAGAVLAWPARYTARRLRALTGEQPKAFRIPKANTALVALTTAILGALTLGIGGAIAGALAGAVAWRTWKSKQDTKKRLTTMADLAETLRALVSELRAGAHPATAAESVAVDAPEAGAKAMRAIAATARLGGDVRQAVRDPLFADVTHAWALAEKHGLPLADVLEAVVRDLDQTTRFANQVTARMAGPRTSAAVLAALPAAGIALGEAMGASPTRVLATTTFGQTLLILGVTLACAGTTWSRRLTNQAVLP